MSEGKDPMVVATALPVATSSSITVPPGASGHSSQGANNYNNATTPMWQHDKQGGKCCGCCCDYRRAVIILAIISICINAFYLYLFAIDSASFLYGRAFDDDQAEDIIDDSLRAAAIIGAGVGLVCAYCALVGAYKFNIWSVALNIIWIAAGCIVNSILWVGTVDELNEVDSDENLSAFPNIIINVVVAALLIYPHVGFIQEVNAGIMSLETYPREEFSCCCVPSRR